MKWQLLFFVFVSFYSFSAGAGSACDDATKVYKVCHDQQESFMQAFDKAKKNHKAMLVVFGADWCPWCLSLNKIFHNEKNTQNIASQYELFEVGLYAYDSKDKIPSGIAVLERVKKIANQKKEQKGIPILAVVDPTNNKATFINTEPLEKNTKTTQGHDETKVFSAIEKARSML